MKCFRLRCYVNNSFLVFHQGTKHSKTIKHSRFALVFHTVFSCLDPLMKHSNSLFTYNITCGLYIKQIGHLNTHCLTFQTPLSPRTEIKSPQRLLKMMILYAGIKMNTCDRFHCYDWVICS